MTDQPSTSDYIRVRVGYAIIPSLATVHLGARVCFTTHLTEQGKDDAHHMDACRPCVDSFFKSLFFLNYSFFLSFQSILVNGVQEEAVY